MITKIHDIKELLARGRVEPDAIFPELKRLAASDQWQTREVAATALVEIGKRHYRPIIKPGFQPLLQLVHIAHHDSFSGRGTVYPFEQIFI